MVDFTREFTIFVIDFIFFVGWSWVVVLRDLAAISGQAKLQPIRGDWYGGFAHVLGLETVETVRAAEYSAFARSLLMIIVFGPLLTVLVIWAKHVALRVYGRAGGKNTKQKLMNAAFLPTPSRSPMQRAEARAHRSPNTCRADNYRAMVLSHVKS